MPIDRRRVLATAGLGLVTLSTGCTGVLSGITDKQTERGVSLQDVDRVGADHPLRFDVSQSLIALGDGSMPLLDIVLETTGDTALFLGYRGTWPEGGLVIDRESDPGGLRVLAASEASGLTVDAGRCPSTDFNPAAGESLVGRRVLTDRRYQVSYRVLASQRDLEQDCPPPGQYRIRSAYQYAPAAAVERVGWENTDRIRFDWGFSLEVRDPDAS